MQAHNQLKKWASILGLVGIFMFSGIVLFQVRAALGWTNPTASPPGGAGGVMVDPSNGNVGVKTSSAPDALTVGGTVNVLSNVIKGVVDPSNDDEAANKHYVDAMSGGQSFTLYAQSKVSVPWNPQTFSYPQGVQTTGGTNVPSCPAGYNSILDGFGPHGLVTGSGYSNSPFWWGPINDPLFCQSDWCGGSISGWTRAYVNNAVAATYSTCSASPYQIVPTTIVNSGTGNNDYYNYFTAKSCERFIDNTPPLNGTYEVCNTCRICVKGLPVQNSSGSQVPPDSRWL